MASAVIVINGSPGSREDLAIGSLVTLTNVDNTGVTQWQWTLLDKPEGSAVTLATPTTNTSTFTPDVEGSYRFQLDVNGGGVGLFDKKVGRVLTRHTGAGIPAAGETTDADSIRGWAKALNRILTKFDRDQRAGIKISCIANGAIAAAGPVVFVGTGTMPNGDVVPTVQTAGATSLALCHTVGWAVASALNAAKVDVVLFGRVATTLSTLGATIGDPVYLGDTLGTLSLTPGTIKRVVGIVLTISATGSVLVLGGEDSAATNQISSFIETDGYPPSPTSFPRGTLARNTFATPTAERGTLFVNVAPTGTAERWVRISDLARVTDVHTVNFTLTREDHRKVISNAGEPSKLVITLPASGAVLLANEGVEYEFLCEDTKGMRIVAQGSDTIRVGEEESAAAGYIETFLNGATIRLMYRNGRWRAMSGLLNWSVV